MGKWHVIEAVFRRNFVSYFSNPVGYLFMMAFVVLCSFFAFCYNSMFFANNIADMEQLNQYIVYLLLFFTPAITMSVWAEEKRSGTEELLLTLPATDAEIVLGKYLSCLAVYTISLAFFGLTSLCVLWYLHTALPDIGLFAANFLGYWMVGAAFLATGMVASVLTANVTVAFILGVLFCSFLTSVRLIGFLRSTTDIDSSGASFLLTIRSFFARLVEYTGIVKQSEPFSNGLVSFPSIVYFASTLFVMLYLNMVLLSLRHWSGSQDSGKRWFHYLSRAACVLVSVASLTLLADRAVSFLPFLQVDLTQERLHKLTQTTLEAIKSVEDQRPVYIEAFVSKNVPRDLGEMKRNLLDMLRQYSSHGGSKVQVAVHEIDLFSEQARDAERVYDIRAVTVRTEEAGRQGSDDVFLGAAFKCGLFQKSIPFFYKGMPVEYEITNMIRSVSGKDRKTVGVLSTDAGFFGSMNMQTFQQNPDWQIVADLKQSFEVKQITSDQPITEKIDCLIVPMASSLTQPQMDNLTNYVKSGKPALIFDDPMPFSNPSLAAREPKPRPNQNPMFGGGGPPPVPKGNVQALWDMLNVEFNDTQIVGQYWNPLTQYEELDEPEFVFIGSGSGNKEAFNSKDSVSKGLQTLIALFPGSVRQKLGSGPTFTPLLSTSTETMVRPWNDIFTSDGMFGRRGMNRRPWRTKKNDSYVLAAHIKGPAVKTESSTTNLSFQDKSATKGAAASKTDSASNVNVIVIADLDLISDIFYDLRRRGQENLRFDNVTFVLNCVDELVGDTTVIELRKRRPIRRHLDRLVEMSKDAVEKSQHAIESANDQAKQELAAAQKSLDEAVDGIRNNTKLDDESKRQQIEQVKTILERELEVKKDEIERKKNQTIRRSKEDLENAKASEQRKIMWFVMLIPPIPIALIGLAVFFRRIAGEKEGVSESRLVRS